MAPSKLFRCSTNFGVKLTRLRVPIVHFVFYTGTVLELRISSFRWGTLIMPEFWKDEQFLLYLCLRFFFHLLFFPTLTRQYNISLFPFYAFPLNSSKSRGQQNLKFATIYRLRISRFRMIFYLPATHNNGRV